MDFNYIKTISEAEEKAEEKVRASQETAKKLVEGKKQVFEREAQEIISSAEEKAAEIMREAQAAAEERAKAVQNETANKCAIMTVRAEKKFDAAADLIIGKVVRR